jgi:hypothetical protein
VYLCKLNHKVTTKEQTNYDETNATLVDDAGCDDGQRTVQIAGVVA